MDSNKLDMINLLLQPYVLDILRILDKPHRFNDLRTLVKNGRTLSLKLSKLQKYGLIENFALKTAKGFANSYVITQKGKGVVKKLETF